MTDPTLDYFFNLGTIRGNDAAQIEWSHASNSKNKLAAALRGPCHMIEADILVGREPREPIMAHPPMTDGDITLQEWLEEVTTQNHKGIKLDFKSLEAVPPSLALLDQVLGNWGAPVWLNADVLPGPGGADATLEAAAFLDAVRSRPPRAVLSLGWTTGGATAGADSPGYGWDMVRQMEAVCRGLRSPLTFPVRAALLGRSLPQMDWLLQQSDRYTLTVWTRPGDVYAVQDLLPYRTHFDKGRIYYDLPDSERLQLCSA